MAKTLEAVKTRKENNFDHIHEPKLKFMEKLSYGFGDFGNGLMFDLGMIFLLKFYTDVLGISSVYGGIIFLVAKLFDAFVDTGVGTYVDSRTKIGKLGKFKPFILYGTVPLAILTTVSFLSPDFSDTGKVIWAFATYLMFNVAYSFVNIPYGSLSASMTFNSDDRTQLSVFRNFGSQSALFVTGILLIPLVKNFDNPAIGYPVVVGALSAAGVIFHLLCVRGVKERHVIIREKKEGEHGVGRKAFMNLVKNGPFAVLATYTLLTITAMFLKQSTQLYYFQYILGKETLVGFVSLVNFIVLIPALFLTTVLSKKYGKKATALIGVAGFIIFEILNFFISGNNVTLFLTLNALSSFFFVIPNTVTWAFIADVVEYGQWKSGVRTEGIIYSSYSFTRKVSQALAGFIPGIMLAVIGYQPNQQQTESTLEGLRGLYFLLPAGLSLVALLLFLFLYKLTDKRHKQIVSELALRDELH
ncbi:glycoside-pentoside-hexuronide (GPH):cation symporter [Macrococcus equi]|uniref:glycoside-pentoside-hexuronide (GPH):cation symporter n=1 Tax=Macrococcus equi TaxID=3395462 RepID=UPI0039BE3A3F